ncbi:MAG: transglycosylase [Agathobacter sp.]|nr:transglycosylase [Agathobacter sp.]MBQ2283633.1 transglycosylase [Agathobacter sp.]
MEQKDWSIPAVIGEAVDILVLIIYCALQIYYGCAFHVAWYLVAMNLLSAALIYGGLTWLAFHPELINRLPREFCRKEIRKFSLRMIRLEKLIFLVGLLIPCIFDAMAWEIPTVYNAAVVILMIGLAIYYEYKILMILKELR